ncbi:MAG: IS1634 family transposase [Gemmatimonadota bacterium]
MFVRTKRSGQYSYLQVVHNERVDGRVRQRVIGTLGRVDELQASAQLDGLLNSLGRFADHSAVLSAHRAGETEVEEALRIGPGLVFERLWRECGIQRTLERLLQDRKFEFSVERAVFLTVLHRLFAPGSDRAAEMWRERYRIEGSEELQLQHLYRAMAWLGAELPPPQQVGATPFAPRTTKDEIEEGLFQIRRDLFSSLDLVFFDTTSIYFEGRGGETLGQRGHSKDHRPDLPQMVVGAVLDAAGRPLCSELWPGNTTDVRTLVPVVDRLRTRFGVHELCVVADRGMISKGTIEALQDGTRNVRYILGARMRRVKEVRDEVLARGGRYREVRPPRQSSKGPAPLQVKEVWVEDRRYIVCLNEEEARKDRLDREAIVASLEKKLSQGEKALVGNKGYRRFLTSTGNSFRIDRAKLEQEARYDGKFVLQTDLDLDAADVALRYKELWQVEAAFRSVKSVLDTRPIYHQKDETIRGHVFCSFLALVLLKELLHRMEEKGGHVEWARLREDLDALEEMKVRTTGRSFILRTPTRGDAGRALQAAGVALGPSVRLLSSDP